MNYTLELCCLTGNGEKTIHKVDKKYQKPQLDVIIPILKKAAQCIEKNNEIDFFAQSFNPNKKALLSNFILTEENDETTLIMPLYLNVIDSNNHVERMILIDDYNL